MLINDMTDFQLVKLLLNQEYMLQKELSEKLNDILGKIQNPPIFQQN